MGHLLEKFYPYLPVSVQNLGISLYGLAWRRERLGGNFDEEVRAFQKRERWTDERLMNFAEQGIRETLVHAFETVPYYQRVWRAAGITQSDLKWMTIANLSRLPVTPKEHLRAEPQAFVARDVARRKLRRYYSSGSTGTPITAICTASEHRRFIAAREARSFKWAGS